MRDRSHVFFRQRGKGADTPCVLDFMGGIRAGKTTTPVGDEANEIDPVPHLQDNLQLDLVVAR